jgi:hypothetical protein
MTEAVPELEIPLTVPTPQVEVSPPTNEQTEQSSEGVDITSALNIAFQEEDLFQEAKKINRGSRPSDVTVRNSFNESILSARNGEDVKKAYDEVVRSEIPLEASLALNRIKKALYFMNPPMVSERIRTKGARLLNDSEKNEVFAQCCRVPPSQWTTFQDNCFPSKSRRCSSSTRQHYLLQISDQIEYSQLFHDMACLASCLARSNEIREIFRSLFDSASKKRTCLGSSSSVNNALEGWEQALQKCNELAPLLRNTHTTKHSRLTKLDPRSVSHSHSLSLPHAHGRSSRGHFKDTQHLRETWKRCKVALDEFMKPIQRGGGGRAHSVSSRTGNEVEGDGEGDDGDGDELEGDDQYFISLYLWLELKDRIDECDWLLSEDESEMEPPSLPSPCEIEVKKSKGESPSSSSEVSDLTAQVQTLIREMQRQQQLQQHLPLPPSSSSSSSHHNSSANMNRERSEVERNLSEKNYYELQALHTQITICKDNMMTYLLLSTNSALSEEKQLEYRRKFEEKEREYYLLSSSFTNI